VGGVAPIPSNTEGGDIDHRWAQTQLDRHGFGGWIVLESGGGNSLVTVAVDLG
jgi:hypothetical protein